MEEEVVTEEQCRRILAKYTQERQNTEEIDNTQEAALTSFSTCLVNNQYDGLIGEQFFLTLAYKQGEKHKNAKFFVKILSKGNPLMYQIAKEITAFEKESFFYETLVPYLREEGFDCNYVPKSYLCESDAIVLEDLGLSSYKGSGKNLPLDLQHCKMCLKTIAKFHTDTILFELQKTKELAWEYKLSEAFPEVFDDTIFRDGNTMVLKYYQYAIKGLGKLIGLIPENTIKLEEFSKAFFKALQNIPPTMQAAVKKFRTVLSHNDLWCNNILYKYGKNNEILSCMLIDFQTINFKPPIVDVLGLLYMNTRTSFRDRYLKDLLSYYYSCFYENIEQGGYNPTEILSEEEFWASYDYLKLNCKLHSLIDRSFTLIPEELYVRHSKSEEQFSNFLFEGRGGIMTELFKSDDNYRDILTDELCELRSMLFQI